METLWQDIKYGIRMLARSPGFTAVAVLTLALGIGASTAIFSVVNPILFESLPYPQAGRILMIWDFGAGGSRLDVTFGTFTELTERSRAFDALAVMKPWQPTITGPAEPERLDGQRVSAGYFPVLAVPPALGRGFVSSDDRLNGPRVVVLSDRLLQRRFNGDAGIIGRQILLDGESFTVVGVMPRTFENVLSPTADLWAPLQYEMSQGQAWGHHLRMVGRLRPGVEADQAASELGGIARAPVAEFPRVPWASLDRGLIVNSLHDEVTRDVQPALLAVLGAVLLLLAIAGVNVTNLLLARGVRRSGEFAVRAALGAPRTRMIRQLLTESLLLAALGGAAGLVVADLGIQALLALSPPRMPRMGAIRMDSAVFAFATGLTTLIGVMAGFVPALHASRSGQRASLQQFSRRATRGHQRIRRALVVCEVALALVLLLNAGLLLRSLQQLFAISPGFDPADSLALQVQTSGPRFDDGPAANRFFARALEEVRQLPGVTSAAFTSQLPLSGDREEYGVHFEAGPAQPAASYSSFRYSVSPGYFETLRIPLRSGRWLGEGDHTGAPRAALISASLAKRRFAAASPLGERLRVGPADGPWFTIVGVVGDVRQTSLTLGESDAVYITPEQASFADRARWLVVRARGDVAALLPALKQAVWSVDKDQPITRAAKLDDVLTASEAERRFAMIVFEAFALAALALAAAGIYGLLAGSVAERTQEIGVRSALGASPANIFALVIQQGMLLTACGIAVGLAGGAAASQVVAAMLFGVSRFDPLTYGSVILLLIAVASAACWIPARRATKVDPMVALRYE